MKSHHTLPDLYNKCLGPESKIRSKPSPHPLLFHCCKCFLNPEHLTEHVRAKHGVSAIYACSKCQNIFTSSEFLERHKQTCHDIYNSWSTPAPYFSPALETPPLNAALIHCKSGDATFDDMRQLNIHTLEHNEVSKVSNIRIEHIYHKKKQSKDPHAITYSIPTHLGMTSLKKTRKRMTSCKKEGGVGSKSSFLTLKKG